MQRNIRATLGLVLILVVLGAVMLSATAPPAAPPAESPAKPAADRPAESQPPPPRREPRRDVVPLDESIVQLHDVVYATVAGADGSDHVLLMDVAFPRASDENLLPAVVYIHGGGWNSGSKNAGRQFLAAFAEGGYLAVAIDYRLSGDAPYPAAVHDCKAAIRFLRAHADDLGIDPQRIGAWGHSAGGHLSALLGTSGGAAALEGTVGEEDGTSIVQCVAAVSAPTDLVSTSPRGRRAINTWLQAPADSTFVRMAREASPLTYIDASDPPFLIVHGQIDRLVPPEQSQRFHDALADAGVEVELIRVPDAGHSIDDARTYVRLAEFFDRHLGGDAAASVRNLARRETDRRRPTSDDARDTSGPAPVDSPPE